MGTQAPKYPQSRRLCFMVHSVSGWTRGVGKTVRYLENACHKAGMIHSVRGWTRGVQVKLWDALRTRAIPERLRCVHDKALYKSTFTFTLPCVYGKHSGEHWEDYWNRVNQKVKIKGTRSMILDMRDRLEMELWLEGLLSWLVLL